MAELVDALDSGSSISQRCASSSLALGTMLQKAKIKEEKTCLSETFVKNGFYPFNPMKKLSILLHSLSFAHSSIITLSAQNDGQSGGGGESAAESSVTTSSSQKNLPRPLRQLNPTLSLLLLNLGSLFQTQ